MRYSPIRRSIEAMYQFVDPAYLNNKRPSVPGGAWPKDLLRRKSIADLQQLWFTSLRERNMLSSTKHHYLVHQEELGAMPAPSRLTMVEETMRNIREVMRERDFEATDRAVAIFKERVAKGIYRYPPGPPLPPSWDDPRSRVRVTLSKRIDAERLRELFGRFDVFESHRGIVSIELSLPPEVLARREEAEKEWEAYMTQKRDVEHYHRVNRRSVYDTTEVELAPGEYLEELVEASKVPAPEMTSAVGMPKTMLERLLWNRRPGHEREHCVYGYFPHNPISAPPTEAPTRPIHPDEIEGPWWADVTYDRTDGATYAASLGIKRIDGVEVVSVVEMPFNEPHSARCPIYQEALRKEEAAKATENHWPHVPMWKSAYLKYSKKRLVDIIKYNYSNVVDYVDREVLLTGRSVWEMPIRIDPTCGGSISIPPHAKEPKTFFQKRLYRDGPTV